MRDNILERGIAIDVTTEDFDSGDTPLFNDTGSFIIYVGTAGIVSFLPQGNPNETPQQISVNSGQYVEVWARKVFSTGTTATNIFVGY